MEVKTCEKENTLGSSCSSSASPQSSLVETSTTGCGEEETLSASTTAGSLDLWSSPLDGSGVVGKLHAGHLGGISYGNIIRWNVSRKWKTPEEKETWYAKFTMSRRKKLVKAFNRQNGLCCFCGIETWLAIEGVKKQHPPAGKFVRHMATADHIIPQFHGGTDRSTNIAMACMDCNGRRGTIPFEEFLEARSDPVRWKAFNRKLTHEYQKRSKERTKKSEERAAQLVWKLAVLFYLYPGMVEVAKSMPKQKRRGRKVTSDEQPAREVPDASL